MSCSWGIATASGRPKACASADVHDADAVYVTVDGQTVEQVLGDLRAALADRREFIRWFQSSSSSSNWRSWPACAALSGMPSSAAPAIRTSSDTSTDLHHRAPGDRTFDVRLERLRQLVETEECA